MQHTDGTPCKEGTRTVPPDFRPCCRAFAGHTDTCEYDIRYEWWSPEQGWVVAIAESAGGGGVAIRFCPHCGLKLQPEVEGESEDAGGQPGRQLRTH